MTKKLVYAIAHNGGVVFAEPERAVVIDRINTALRTAKTWAEFRKAMPRAEYSEIVRAYDESCERRPRGVDRFDAEQVPGFSDGDYPPWLQQEMEFVLPRSILNEFATCQSSVLNGLFWMIPQAKLKAVCAALGHLGYTVEEGTGLDFH